MSAEPVAPIVECEECARPWLPADEDGWCCYITIDEELGFYCPECAEREFDPETTGC